MKKSHQYNSYVSRTYHFGKIHKIKLCSNYVSLYSVNFMFRTIMVNGSRWLKKKMIYPYLVAKIRVAIRKKLNQTSLKLIWDFPKMCTSTPLYSNSYHSKPLKNTGHTV